MSQAWLKLFADSWFAHDDSSSPHPDIADASTCMIFSIDAPFYGVSGKATHGTSWETPAPGKPHSLGSSSCLAIAALPENAA